MDENIKNKSFLDTVSNIDESRKEGLSNTPLATKSKNDFNIINNNINSCIDYFKIRVIGKWTEKDKFFNEFLSALLIDPVNYDSYPFVGGYPVNRIYDEDTFLLGNNEEQKTKDGKYCWYIELKGHGCRMFDLRCKNNGVDSRNAYIQLFKTIFDFRSKGYVIDFYRIDLAIDDFSGLIKINELREKFLKGHFISKLRKRINEEDLEFGKKIESKGFSITLGGKTSRQLCIYDKAAERDSRGYDVFIKDWIRYESRFLHKNADWAAIQIYTALLDNNLAFVSSRLLGGLIEFKEDNNRVRSQLCNVKIWSKWEKFLGTCEKIEYKSQQELEMDITMHKKKKWVVDVPYKILTMVYLIDPKNFNSFLKFCLAKGIARLKNVDLNRVNYHLVSTNDEPLFMDEAKDLVKKYVGSYFDFGDVPEYIQNLFNLTDDDIQALKNNPGNVCDIIQERDEIIRKTNEELRKKKTKNDRSINNE
ncbi:MAG: replication initiation factor domain-containing protein [Bacilli bacterium]